MLSASLSPQRAKRKTRESPICCIQLMRLAGVRTTPVMRGIELVGVLTFTDVLSVVVRSGQAPA